MRIDIIGAGISGIVGVHSLRKCGHDKFVYEKTTLYGDLQRPSHEQMQRSIRNILDWKRQNINYEPSRF